MKESHFNLGVFSKLIYLFVYSFIYLFIYLFWDPCYPASFEKSTLIKTHYLYVQPVIMRMKKKMFRRARTAFYCHLLSLQFEMPCQGNLGQLTFYAIIKLPLTYHLAYLPNSK